MSARQTLILLFVWKDQMLRLTTPTARPSVLQPGVNSAYGKREPCLRLGYPTLPIDQEFIPDQEPSVPPPTLVSP